MLTPPANALDKVCIHRSHTMTSSPHTPMITLEVSHPITALAVHPTNDEVLVGMKGSRGILAAHGLDMLETLETFSGDFVRAGGEHEGEREEVVY